MSGGGEVADRGLRFLDFLSHQERGEAGDRDAVRRRGDRVAGFLRVVRMVAHPSGEQRLFEVAAQVGKEFGKVVGEEAQQAERPVEVRGGFVAAGTGFATEPAQRVLRLLGRCGRRR